MWINVLDPCFYEFASGVQCTRKSAEIIQSLLCETKSVCQQKPGRKWGSNRTMKDDALFLDIATLRVYRKVDLLYVGLMSIPATIYMEIRWLLDQLQLLNMCMRHNFFLLFLFHPFDGSRSKLSKSPVCVSLIVGLLQQVSASRIQPRTRLKSLERAKKCSCLARALKAMCLKWKKRNILKKT